MGEKENKLLLNIKSASNIEGIIKKADGGGMNPGSRQRHTLGFISKEIKKDT